MPNCIKFIDYLNWKRLAHDRLFIIMDNQNININHYSIKYKVTIRNFFELKLNKVIKRNVSLALENQKIEIINTSFESVKCTR